MSLQPTVAVLVLNYNGVGHLRTCLPSLDALDYGPAQIIVVDNGSSDGSAEYVRRHHPKVRVLEMGANLGFSKAYNRAVPQCDADYVVLLNNDTHVDRSWLTALVDTAQRHQAAAAASAIVDWDGSRIDFVGGLPTVLGHAWQIDHGQTVGAAPLAARYPERQLLFGCGGSVLIRRDAYLACGGFDEDFFAYFEDVDLGWRMTLKGFPTVFAPTAVTYHRLHGTWGGWALALRLRLYERNALYMLVKNYGDEALARTLPAALALTLGRAIGQAALPDECARFGKDSPEAVAASPQLIATLIGLEDFARALPRLLEKRAAIQSTRRVADEDIFRLMPDALKLHELGRPYLDAAHALLRDFGIETLVGAHRASVTVPSLTTEPQVNRANSGANRGAPRVSVVVLTASGARHLPDCLDSLRLHDWPADRTEVVVVDNGSAEDPSEVAERHYPGVRVVRTGANLGFSGGNNAGARIATGQWLAFLNDDTRVDARWLDELIAVAERRGAAAVGALVTDWSGTRVDFAGGLVNFEGRGYAQSWDRPLAAADLTERPLLFGCGAALLIRRDAFESSGGWDEPTFAYYEDVELGWRLWLLGHEVWFAPNAIVYHRHHGTSGADSPARLRAFERNALRMLYALLDDRNLGQVLSAALLLSVDRALLGTPFSRAHEGTENLRAPEPRPARARLVEALRRRGVRRQYGVLGNLRRVGWRELGGALREAMRQDAHQPSSVGGRIAYLIEHTRPSADLERHVESIPVAVAAQLLGIHDFLAMLPELSARRAWLQARRRRSDAEILARFGGCWMEAVPSPHGQLHIALRERLLAALPLPQVTA